VDRFGDIEFGKVGELFNGFHQGSDKTLVQFRVGGEEFGDDIEEEILSSFFFGVKGRCGEGGGGSGSLELEVKEGGIDRDVADEDVLAVRSEGNIGSGNPRSL